MSAFIQRTEIPNSHFSLHKTIECGQVFRYKKIGVEDYLVFSGEKACRAYSSGSQIVLETDSPDYFCNYFDLNSDYERIERQVGMFEECRDAVRYCEGLHILRQNLFETIIGFLLSSNNNIPRIQGILSKLCERTGVLNVIKYTNVPFPAESSQNSLQKDEYKTENYYSFPTPQRLAALSANDFRQMGCGYRAAFLESTIAELANGNLLDELKIMPDDEAENRLSRFKGVGPKVRDCILLFGLNHTNRYPVDTWVFKASKTEKLNTLKKVREYYVSRYGNLSGYAQQYVFYYGRSTAKK